MSRSPKYDREDLFAEATALRERAEYPLAETGATIVIGRRGNGCLSVYFGADPAYHFNTRHELRRAFLGDKLLKAEQGRLIELTRRQGAATAELHARALAADEQVQVLADCQTRLRQLRVAITGPDCPPLRQTPHAVAMAELWSGELAHFETAIRVALSPHAR